MLSTKSEHAIYLPAISAGFAMIGHSLHLKRKFQFSETDLNFLDPASGLFHYPYALYSAGQAAKSTNSAAKASIVSTRDRNRTTVIGDSGGFQIQQGTIPFSGISTTQRMLRWLENHGDFSMTLDFPTGGIDSGNVSPHTKRLIAQGHNLQAMSGKNGLSLDYNACLMQSLINLDYFVQHRKAGATEFLNVIQGRNELESKTWYDAVKQYGLEGWAFAGMHQSAFSLVLNRLLDMLQDGYLHKARWIHVLGVATMPVAFLLTTTLRCIRQINDQIEISFDAANPFQAASRFEFYSSFRFDKYGYQITDRFMPKLGNPSDTRTLNELCHKLTQPISIQRSGMMFPREVEPVAAETAIGDRVTVGEICAGSKGVSDVDTDATWVLMNHNVEVYVRAFEALNKRYDADPLHDHLPIQVYSAGIYINEIFKEALSGRMKKARSLIKQCATELDVFAENR